jgi:hypothetical protein
VLTFIGCNDDPKTIGEAVRKWDAFVLEDAMNRAGLQAMVVRSPEEFLEEELGRDSTSRRFVEGWHGASVGNAETVGCVSAPKSA